MSFLFCINNQNPDSGSSCRLGFDRFIANFKFWIKQNKKPAATTVCSSPRDELWKEGFHLSVKLSIFYCSLKTRGSANLSLTPFSQWHKSPPGWEGCAGAGLDLHPGQAEEDLLGSQHKPQAENLLLVTKIKIKKKKGFQKRSSQTFHSLVKSSHLIECICALPWNLSSRQERGQEMKSTLFLKDLQGRRLS